MTCHCCQTWNGDDEHRCGRCGRRLRSTPTRTDVQAYPIAATATARAYDFDQVVDSSGQMLSANEAGTKSDAEPHYSESKVQAAAQPSLFNQVSQDNDALSRDGRVIPFTSLASAASVQSIRARAAELVRPGPVQNGKVEVSPRQGRSQQSRQGVSRTRTLNPESSANAGQQRLDFLGSPEGLRQPQSTIICDAPVAPPSLRAQAALVDMLVMALGWLAASSIFMAAKRVFLQPAPLHSAFSSAVSFDKYDASLLLVIALSIAVLYHLLWCCAARDTIGMQSAGLRLVDFDGNTPSTGRRYVRFFGSILSCAAAGVGIVWAFVDQDSLTWHDHMSSTLPTFTPNT